jgi:hypothetical protein
MRKSLVVSVALLMLLPTSAYATAGTFNGEAIVRSIGENRVAVLLDTNADKAIDHGFLLESDLPVPATGERCVEASVEYTDSYVRVTYKQHVIDLWVAGYPEPPAAPEQTDSTKFVGSSLMHSSGDSGCTLDGALRDAGRCFNYAQR